MANDLRRPMLTKRQIAETCAVSMKTVERWIAMRALIGHRLGRQWRIAEADLRAFLAERRR